MKSKLEDKASVFMDSFYKEKGAISIIPHPDRKFDDWDKVVKFPNITYKIEEKARIGDYNDILVEVLEDLKTGDLGWIYQTKADIIIYVVYQKEGDEKPKRIYKIIVTRIKEYLIDHARELFQNSNVAPLGYGLTLNIFMPLEIGKQIYP